MRAVTVLPFPVGLLRRSFPLAAAVLAALGGPSLRAQSDGLPRGCHEMPYVRYEAEAGSAGGGAISRTAFDFDPAKTASEASNRHYLGLPVNGAYVQWTVTNVSDGVTLRFTLPDNAAGDGVSGSLEVQINGAKVKTIYPGSYWAWTYFVSSHPQNTPGARPRMRFDEIHFGLPAKLQPGDVLKLVKTNGDAYEYGIDFVELEEVPPALGKPAGFVSVTDHGASGTDGYSDSAAFQNAWAAAKAAGTGLYIPPGRFLLQYQWWLGDTTNLAIQGAGIWHTEVFFSTKAVGGGGIYAGANTENLDISHFFMGSALNERHIVPGQVSNYKAFDGAFGSGSSIHHMWITHFEAGTWCGEYAAPIRVTENFDFAHNRVRGTYADGVNFTQGTRYSTVRQCSFRDNGDDAMAVWPDNTAGAPEARHNTFRNNTVEFLYRAGGAGIFGGFGHEIHHNLFVDGTDSSGVRFTEDFPGYHFENNTQIRVYENTFIGRGTSLDLWNQPQGAIQISGEGVRHVYFENNDILDSPRHAIQLRGGTNLFFTNMAVRVTGLDSINAPGGAAIRQYELGGSATFRNLVLADIENNPAILQETGGYTLAVNNQFPLVNRSHITVPEGGTAAFGVCLSFAPAGTVTVQTARISGDADLAVQSGATLFFHAGNWSNLQTVVLAAAEDADAVEDGATIQCRAVGYEGTTLIATEFDNDLNHPPLAVDDAAETVQGQLAILNVLTNDSDPDLQALFIQAATDGAHGQVVHAPTQATYVPDAGFHGADSFTYVAADGAGGAATGRVQVLVQKILIPNPYRVEIQLPGYDREEPLTNFPFLLRFDAAISNFSYSQFASGAGYDLRFSNTARRELNYEIEAWDPNGTSYVWVQIPVLTNGTALWATWGAAGNVERPDYTTNGATWSAGYAGVYHAGGTNGVRRDSTTHARHGTVFGDVAAVPGTSAGGDAFDGSYDYVEIPSTFGLFNGTVPVTVEFWFRADRLAPGTNYQTSPVLFQGRGEHSWMATFGDYAPSNAVSIRLEQNGWATPTTVGPILTNRWYHYATVYAPSGANNWKTFLDGALAGQGTRTGAVKTELDKNAYGGNAGEVARWFAGTLDEIRISSVTRSSNWLWATWQNLVSNAAGVAFGNVQRPAPENPTILVDFGPDGLFRCVSVASPDANGNYWNSVGSVQADLVSSSNQPTAVDIGFVNAFTPDSYNGPAGSVTNDPPAPADLAQTVFNAGALGALGVTNAVYDYFEAGAGTAAGFVLSDLDPAKRYDLSFFGSRQYPDGETAGSSASRTTRYSVCDSNGTVLVSAALGVGEFGRHNSNTVALLAGLAPDAGHRIHVRFAGLTASNAGYLNCLKIDVADPPPQPARTVLVDFGNASSFRGVSVASPDPNGNYWNSLAGQAGNLVDAVGEATPLGLEITTAYGTDSYNGPAGIVTNEPPAPEEIGQTVFDAAALGILGVTNAVLDYINGVDQCFILSGLDPVKIYRLAFFGSHKFSDNDTTVYSVYSDSQYTGLVASASLGIQMPGAPWLHNSNAVAVISNLVPQANQSLYVKFTGSAGGSGYLNAMQIDIQVPGGTNRTWVLSAAATAGGSVVGSPNGFYADGSTVTVSAQPAAYYHAVHWTGDVPGGPVASNVLQLLMDRNRDVTAVFAENLAVHGTPEWWLARFGWTNDFDAAALSDIDFDGHFAWEEHRAGTDPTNGHSVLALAWAGLPSGTNPGVLAWPGVSGKTYQVWCSTNLFEAPVVCASNLPARYPLNSYTQSVLGVPSGYFSVGVEE